MQEYLLDIYRELKVDYRFIKTTYNLLDATNEQKIPVHPAGKWLLENMYVIEKEYKISEEQLSNSVIVDLPNIKPEDGRHQLRIFFIANEIVEKNMGVIDDGIVSDYIKKFQKHTYITFLELSYLPIMLKVATIKYIKNLCKALFASTIQKINAEKAINLGGSRKLEGILNKSIKKLGKKSGFTNKNGVSSSNTAYIEHITYRIKDMGKAGESLLNNLKEETSKIGITVEESIEKEHTEIAKITNLIGNAITSMKTIAVTNWEEVLININRIDEMLLQDYTSEYTRCDYKTKGRYRAEVIHLAKKYKVSEIYIAKKVIECSEKYKMHVGHFLIGSEKAKLIKMLGKSTFGLFLKEKVFKPILPILHILNLTILSLVITFGIDFTFTKSYTLVLRIILDILFFSLSMEVADKIISFIALRIFPAKPLPRFNFAKTINEDNATMIVMPTIITSTQKLEQMVNKMEVTYLANRSQNMYYMLLGDCTQNSEKEVSMDRKLAEYGRELVEKLNEKYPSNPKLFNYIYRKRVYSEGEECFMGWERKRGALTELNSLLLNKLTETQIQDKFYLTYTELPKVKYVITIDEDTSLSLNSAKELVGIISHPLNKPVLSKNGKTIKRGYGLIQPSVGLDIEAANNSIFSKVFGGFGGLDIYTNTVSNLYQDVFGEAIYTGKGIYDIELFDKLLGNKVPENLILSHDLLEGSFLRTGLASDVEVQDGFPANFISYTKRNHRWFRGDMQISKYILDPRTGLNLLSRYKMLDNLRREILPVKILLILLITAFLPGDAFVKGTIISFIALNFGYIISVLSELIFGKNAERKLKQYIPVIFGIRANLLKMVENIVTIPYKSYVVLNAYITSLYRMYISKKKLLEWTTADSLEKQAKDKLSYFYKNMWPNTIVGIFMTMFGLYNLIFIGLTNANILLIAFGIFSLIAPMAAYIMSKKVIFESIGKLNEKEKNDIIEIGQRTWNFFDTFMNEVNNFLPPDNFQENRRPKTVSRTSATNIGFGLLAVVNAYDLDYITLDAAVTKLENTLNTVTKLEKWNGHLYNWYNTISLEPLKPLIVSTVDSGNFVSSIYVVREFVISMIDSKIVIDSIREKLYNLKDICDDIIKNTDFSLLYIKTRNIFSIGYNVEANKLINGCYDILMSESRLTSLIAIAVSNVTSKHWFALARNLVKIDNKKGLVSWSGTSFEYFMPNLFTKTYKYTLIDESLSFSINSQMKYAKSVNLPWGMSESAFAVQDNEQNYQYKAFGVPWLGLKRGLNDNLVISPYASLMCLDYAPRKVYNNIKSLRKYNSYSQYGFYESIDFTRQHIGENKKYEVVKTYMAHHQGMILTAINNYMNDGIIKERFHKVPSINAAEILLKERVPLSVLIKESRFSKENKFVELPKDDYTSFVSGLKLEGDNIDKIDNTKLCIHTNGRMTTNLLYNGKNFMYYNNKAITKNRYAGSITLGNNVIFTDRGSGKIWSATLEPQYNMPEYYEVSCSLASTKFMRKDLDIKTTMEVCIAPEFDYEIRKITLQNVSNLRREVIINTELELAMSDEAANIIHPAFNSLFIEEDFDTDLQALIAIKRARENTSNPNGKNITDSNNVELYVYSKLVGIDMECEVETEKINLTKDNGSHAFDGITVKYPLWPVMAYRARIFLDPNEVQTFYYIVGATNKRYNIAHAIVNADKETLDNQMIFAEHKENILSKYLKLYPGKAEMYNGILSKVFFVGNTKKLSEKFWDKKYDKSMLWKFGISGDIPLITVKIGRIEDSTMIREVINFMDYVKSKKIDLDIVLMVDEELYTDEPIKHHLLSVLDKVIYTSYTRGNIYVVNIKALDENEVALFEFLSKYEINNIKDMSFEYIAEEKKDMTEQFVE